MKSAKCTYIPGRCHRVNGAFKKKALYSFIFCPFYYCTLHTSFLSADRYKATMKEEKNTCSKKEKSHTYYNNTMASQIQTRKFCVDNFSRSVAQIVLCDFDSHSHRLLCSLKILIRNKTVTKPVITCSKQKFFVQKCSAVLQRQPAAVHIVFILPPPL